MRYLLLSSMILMSLFSIGCDPPTRSELYGTYIADYELAKEKLVLYEDGTFYQEVMLKSNSKIDKTKGTWSYVPRTKGVPSSGYITFHENFMYVPDKFGEKVDPDYARKPHGAGLPVGRFFRITLGSSEIRVYKKID